MVQVYPEWQKVAYVRLNNPPTMDDYQVRWENFPHLYGMNSDFSCIRFTDVYGRLLSHNILEYTSGTSATVDVKVEKQDSAILLFYGNSFADDDSDPDNVYVFWDSFEDTTKMTDGDPSTTIAYVTGRYGGKAIRVGGTSTYREILSPNSLGQGHVFEADVLWPSGGGGTSLAAIMVGNDGAGSDVGYQAIWDSRSAGRDIHIRRDYNITWIVANGTYQTAMSQDVWMHLKLEWETDGTLSAYLYNTDGTLYDSCSGVNTAYSSGIFGIGTYQESVFDNYIVRKHLSTEPTPEIVITKPNPYYGISYIPQEEEASSVPLFIPEQLALQPLGGLF